VFFANAAINNIANNDAGRYTANERGNDPPTRGGGRRRIILILMLGLGLVVASFGFGAARLLLILAERDLSRRFLFCDF
jgi:hypothetical protein